MATGERGMKMLRRDINLIDTRRISKGFEGVMINPIKCNMNKSLQSRVQQKR